MIISATDKSGSNSQCFTDTRTWRSAGTTSQRQDPELGTGVRAQLRCLLKREKRLCYGVVDRRADPDLAQSLYAVIPFARDQGFSKPKKNLYVYVVTQSRSREAGFTSFDRG